MKAEKPQILTCPQCQTEHTEDDAIIVPAHPTARPPIPERLMIGECRGCGVPFYRPREHGADGD